MPFREFFSKGKEPDVKAALRSIGCPACSDKPSEDRKSCNFCVDGQVPRVIIVNKFERKIAERHQV